MKNRKRKVRDFKIWAVYFYDAIENNRVVLKGNMVYKHCVDFKEVEKRILKYAKTENNRISDIVITSVYAE